MNAPPFCLSSANHRWLHCSSDSCLSSYPHQISFLSFNFFPFTFTITADITNLFSSPSKTATSTAVNSSFLPSFQAQKNQTPPGHHHHHRQQPSDLTEATSSSAPFNRQNRQAQTSGVNYDTRKERSTNTASTAQHQRCILRPPAVRLANPVNYVPRITPIAVPHPWQISDEAQRDAYPLLTISERRRSQLPSPSSLVVEHSQGEIESWRSSIAVPPGQRHSFRGSREHGRDDVFGPEMAAATAATTTTTVEGAAADNLRPPEQAYLGQNAGSADSQQPRRVPSQVSLRPQSQIASIPSNTGQQQADMTEELAWGPAHPCFPHINPHVPIGSQEYVTTRIIRIRRDWMIKGDLAPTFSNLYPEILDPLLSEQEFRKIIATVNDELTKAFDPFRFQNWIDGALGLVTGWLWEDLGAPAIKRHLQRVEAWIEKWNREVGAKDGVHIWSLRRTAYMSLDIQIPDPRVGIIPNEDSLPGTRPSTGFGGR